MFNTGFEFSLFKGILNGTVEYYNNTTQDLFLDRQLSRTSGSQSITNNLGKLRNSGVEVGVNVNIIRNTNFTWSVEANYSYNKNELLDQNGLEKISRVCLSTRLVSLSIHFTSCAMPALIPPMAMLCIMS